MTRKPTKELRCAIYTRKSTEHGLELGVRNSLRCPARSLRGLDSSRRSHEGWTGAFQAL